MAARAGVIARVALAVAAALAGTGCYPDWITATGPITKIENGDICVRTDERVPGRGCAHYERESEVAGLEVGDCVTMRMYNESVRLHDVRRVDCPR